MPFIANPDFYPVLTNGTLTVPAATGFLANDFSTVGTVQATSILAGVSHGSLSAFPDGHFIYTPNPGFTGVDSFTYQAFNGIGDATATVTIDVYHPTLTATPDGYTVVQNGTLTVPASGLLTNDLSNTGTLQADQIVQTVQHGSLAAFPDGHFTYTPDPGFTGVDSFTYRINDGVTNATATATITVTPSSVSVADFYIAHAGQTLTVPAAGFLANDYTATGTLSATAITQGVSHGALTAFPDGHFTYTPDVGFTGQDSFTVQESDSVTTFSGVVTINVLAGDPPVAQADYYHVPTGGSLTVSSAAGFLVNDFDPDNTAILADQVVAGVQHGTLAAFADGHFTYTPDAGFVGDDTFTVRIHNVAGLTAQETVTIAVTAANDAPVAQGGSASGNEDSPINGSLAASDLDSPVLTFSRVTDAAHGTVTVNPNGTFSYTPNHDFNGSDSFTFKANDGALDSNVATFNLTVNAVNDAPVNTVPGALTADQAVGLAISGLSVSDVDAGSGAITTTLSLAHGILTVASAGGAAVGGSGTGTVTLTGTVAQINTTLGAAHNVVYSAGAFAGTDTLTVTTNDGGHTGSGGPLSDTDLVSIAVTPHPLGTPGDDSFTAPAGSSIVTGFGGNDTINFGFKLVDATITFSGNQIIIDGPGGSSHTVTSGLETFVFTDGTVNERDGNPLVDDLFYYSQNHDVWLAHADADAHFDAFGWKEGRNPNAWFDTKGYLSHYTDVAAANIDPLTHYDQHGWQEGRDPSAQFDTRLYQTHYADVAAAQVNPLAQFLAWGMEEQRQPFGDGVFA